MDDVSDVTSRLQRELSNSIEQVGTLRGLLNFIAQEVKYFKQSRKAPAKNMEAIGLACEIAKDKHTKYRQSMGWDTQEED